MTNVRLTVEDLPEEASPYAIRLSWAAGDRTVVAYALAALRADQLRVLVRGLLDSDPCLAGPGAARRVRSELRAGHD